MSACVILRAEHSVIRQVLATQTAVLRAGQWHRDGPALARLRELIEFEELFEHTCHRPKRNMLASALDGHSPVVELMLADWRSEDGADDELMRLVHELLSLVEGGGRDEEELLAGLLERRRQLVLARLQAEENVLVPEARRCLPEDRLAEMAAVFSSVLRPDAQLYEPDHYEQPAHRNPQYRARFETTGFMLDHQLSLDEVPVFPATHSGAVM